MLAIVGVFPAAITISTLAHASMIGFSCSWTSFAAPNCSTVSGGGWHSLALTDDGKLLSWGDVRNTPWMRPVIDDTPTGGGFTVASAGVLHSLALKDNTIVAWGVHKEFYENLVNGAPTGPYFKGVSAGSSHCVALKLDGSLVSWGSDEEGQSDTHGR